MSRNTLNKVALVFIASFLLGLTYNFISPKGIPLIAEEINLKTAGIEQLISKSPKTETIEEVEFASIVDLATAYGIYEKELAVFVDGRDNWDFAEGRIKGAINIPEYNFDDHLKKYSAMDKSLNYVIYCGGEDCDISTRLAKKLSELGFKNLYIFPGGWDEWTAANFPVEHD